jgi:hypothetical protein
MNTNEKCLVCERQADETPLLVIWYKGQNYWICPQHLPTLIHKPQQLADKFPGANFAPAEGH